MAHDLRIVGLDERDRWEAEHRIDGLPSQSWAYAWALRGSGIEPKLAVVSALGARMLLPFFEREWLETTDVATIQALSGASIKPTSSAPLALWREYAASQGWVTGYIQLALSTDLGELLPNDQPVAANAVFLLDLNTSDPLRSVSEIVRRKIRKAADLGAEIVDDRSELAECIRRLYPATMERVGARPQYDVQASSLDRWVRDPTSIVLGARLGDSVEAVSVFCAAGPHAEYNINASSPIGRQLAAWLIWNAVERLRGCGVETLNLGGGFRPGDGVYRFKERFHGQLRPLVALHQIYNRELYDELCRGASVDSIGPSDWFPPYRGLPKRKRGLTGAA
jgi:hypothetical protein